MGPGHTIFILIRSAVEIRKYGYFSKIVWLHCIIIIPLDEAASRNEKST